MKAIWGVLVIVLVAGCGGGARHHNPWEGRYQGSYDYTDDYGDLDIYVHREGDIDGSWASRMDGATGNVWGNISDPGYFAINTKWFTGTGHGEIQHGTRILIIDDITSRAPGAKLPKFTPLKQVSPNDNKQASAKLADKSAGDLIGS